MTWLAPGFFGLASVALGYLCREAWLRGRSHELGQPTFVTGLVCVVIGSVTTGFWVAWWFMPHTP